MRIKNNTIHQCQMILDVQKNINKLKEDHKISDELKSIIYQKLPLYEQVFLEEDLRAMLSRKILAPVNLGKVSLKTEIESYLEEYRRRSKSELFPKDIRKVYKCCVIFYEDVLNTYNETKKETNKNEQ